MDTQPDIVALPALVAKAFATDGPVAQAFIAYGRAFRTCSAQMDYAAAVAETFLGGSGGDGAAVSVLEAAAGTGKSLGYLVPMALFCALTGKRGIVATSSPAAADHLCRHELAIAADVAFALTDRRLSFARRHAASDFLSPAKIAILSAEVDAGAAELRAALTSLAACCEDSGLLTNWQRDNGVWPGALHRRDVTLAAADGSSDAHAAHLAAADGADILVVPQSLLLQYMRDGDASFGCAVIDEADALPEALAQANTVHVSTLDLAPGAAKAAFARLAHRLSPLHKTKFVSLIGPRMADVRAEARAIAVDLRDEAPDLDRFIAACDDPLGAAAPLLSWSPCVTQPAFEVVPVNIPRLDRPSVGAIGPVVVTGHSLGDMRTFRQSIGLGDGTKNVPETSSGRFMTPRFGSLTFNLSHPDAPRPSIDGAADGNRNPDWYDYAEDVCLRVAELRQRTLVLTCNFQDTIELAARLRADGFSQVIEHAQGERLSESLAAFRAHTDAILIAPNIWEGVDLPGLVRHLVIPRLPIGRRGQMPVQMQAAVARAGGLSEPEAARRLFEALRQKAQRKLAHGIARAVRQHGDECQVWIADARFPLPLSLTDNPRLRLSPADPAFRPFSQCIPERFRSGLFATYPSAKLIDYEPRARPAPVAKRRRSA